MDLCGALGSEVMHIIQREKLNTFVRLLLVLLRVIYVYIHFVLIFFSLVGAMV